MAWRDDKSQVMVYMPREMHNELKSVAAASEVSVNNKILEIIRNHLDRTERQAEHRNTKQILLDIEKKIEHMEDSILKEIGLQGVESLNDRDAVKNQINKVYQKLGNK